MAPRWGGVLSHVPQHTAQQAQAWRATCPLSALGAVLSPSLDQRRHCVLPSPSSLRSILPMSYLWPQTQRFILSPVGAGGLRGGLTSVQCFDSADGETKAGGRCGGHPWSPAKGEAPWPWHHSVNDPWSRPQFSHCGGRGASGPRGPSLIAPTPVLSPVRVHLCVGASVAGRLELLLGRPLTPTPVPSLSLRTHRHRPILVTSVPSPLLPSFLGMYEEGQDRPQHWDEEQSD